MIRPRCLGEQFTKKTMGGLEQALVRVSLSATLCFQSNSKKGYWGGLYFQAALYMHVDWKMCGSCGWLSPVSLPLKKKERKKKNTCQEKLLLYGLWLPDAGDNGWNCRGKRWRDETGSSGQPHRTDMSTKTQRFARFVGSQPCCAEGKSK